MMEISLTREQVYRYAGFDMTKLDFAIPMGLWKKENHKGEMAAHNAVSYYGEWPDERLSRTKNRPFVDFAGGRLVWDWEAQLLLVRRIHEEFGTD